MASSAQPLYVWLTAVAVPALVYLAVRLLLYPLPLPGSMPYDRPASRRLLGDVPFIVSYTRRTRESSDAPLSIARRLGAPLVQVMAPRFVGPIVAVADTREVEDILLRRNREFDRSKLTTGYFAALLPRATLSQTTTPALRAQKRLWSDVMGAEFLRNVVAPGVHAATADLVELWRLKAVGGATPGAEEKDEVAAGAEPFNVHTDFMFAALDAIWVAVLGSQPGVTQRQIRKLRKEDDAAERKSHDKPAEESEDVDVIYGAMVYLNRMIESAMASVWPELSMELVKYSPRFRRFKAATDARLSKLMSAAVERFNRSFEKAEGDGEELDTCAMDLVLRRRLLAAKKAGEPTPDPSKDQAMLEELMLLLMAGHDSTANTLCWFVKLVSANPRVQDTLRAALLAAFPKPNTPSAADILDAEIPYLEAAIEETVRSGGTAAAVARTALVDTEILGHRIPKGTNLVLATRVNHPPAPVDESLRSATSQAAWEKRRAARKGQDADPWLNLGAFEPRRWLTIDEEGKEVFDAYALPSIGFSGGFRGCFGRKLAMQELKIMITLLTLNFEFLPLPEHLAGMEGEEAIFRRPQQPYGLIKAL